MGEPRADSGSLKQPEPPRVVRPEEGTAAKPRLVPLYADENHNVLTGVEAVAHLAAKSDLRFLQRHRGVVEVDAERWREAQRYERRTWMEGSGRRAREDRNENHEQHFDGYSAIRGFRFTNAIEVGCGPFTNIARILKHTACDNVTLLDPLIHEYVSHPHSAFKHGRLGGRFGKQVQFIDIPLEDFCPRERFDLVVMINVLEHCISLPKVLANVVGLTSPDGVFVFHDKLIADDAVDEYVEKIYDAGHPIRVAGGVITNFLARNYSTLFSRHVTIPTEAYVFDSLYFIGRKR